MSNEYAGRYPEDSQVVLTLVLGILSVVFCQVLGPFAWSIGNSELRGIEAGRRPPENRGMASAGRILGIIGTVLLGLALVGVVIAIFAGVIAVGSQSGMN